MIAPLTIEEQYWATGRDVVGTDEAGRGCLCGPVVCAAVSFNKNLPVDANDSKKLSVAMRKSMCTLLEKQTRYGVTSRSARYIDANNILSASLDGMRDAVMSVITDNQLDNPIVLVDGNRPIPNLPYEQKCIVKGDSKSRSIAAASVFAKVYRDDYMVMLNKITGNKYALDCHKGYPSRRHYDALKQHGPSDFHRQSFRLTGNYSTKKVC